MVDLSIYRDCTSKNELEKSLKKSIWPPRSRKWLGILTDDVSQHTRQSSSSFQSAVVRIIFYLSSASEESPPRGAPSTWLMMYCIVISYDLKL